MKLNPIVEAYATVDGTFTWFFNEDWWFKISGYVDPARTSILDGAYWLPVNNYPTWWVKNEGDQVGRCFGLKSQNFPVHAQIWLDFGYPTCLWSITDFLNWESTIPNGAWTWSNLSKRYSEEGLKCTSAE